MDAELERGRGRGALDPKGHGTARGLLTYPLNLNGSGVLAAILSTSRVYRESKIRLDLEKRTSCGRYCGAEELGAVLLMLMSKKLA